MKPTNALNTSRSAAAGWTLIAFGVIGVIFGLVPLGINTLRIVSGHNPLAATDFAAHGVEAMDLSVEWAMLSCAMGTYLGALLLWAGFGWLRGRPWAALVTWMYVACGLAVNVTDMTIFIFAARPGIMRTQMLVLDGIATVIPVAVTAWLIRHQRRAVHHAGATGSSGRG